MTSRKVKDGPVEFGSIARSNLEPRQALQTCVIANIHKSARFEYAIEDPGHVPVKKWLRPPVRKEKYCTRDVLANRRQRFKLVPGVRELAASRNHFPREGFERNRSPLPEANWTKCALKRFLGRHVNTSPATKLFEERIEEAADCGCLRSLEKHLGDHQLV